MLYLVAHPATAAFGPGPLWGIDLLAYLGAPQTAAFAVLSLILFAVSLFAHRLRVPFNP